jgi:hypothetical protein
MVMVMVFKQQEELYTEDGRDMFFRKSVSFLLNTWRRIPEDNS